MKSKTLILVLILIASIIGISGCTSQNSDNVSSNYSNQTSTSQINSTQTTPATTKAYESTGICTYVVDGDTIDVQGVGRIRFVGVNTPERGQSGYQEAKDFVVSQCLGKTIGLDIDNAKHYDKYGRTLAVVYVGDTNLNAELLKKGYAEVMYIPPSEFDPYAWAGNTNSITKITSSNTKSVSGTYIANSNSKKFHLSSCSYAAKMSESNKVFYKSRAEAIAAGYEPCKVCKP